MKTQGRTKFGGQGDSWRRGLGFRTGIPPTHHGYGKSAEAIEGKGDRCRPLRKRVWKASKGKGMKGNAVGIGGMEIDPGMGFAIHGKG